MVYCQYKITSHYMHTITTKLIAKAEIAEGTYQFDFEQKDFDFTAGQYVIVDIDHPRHKDQNRKFRSLSIASAPHEDMLTFIMRSSDSGFKKSLVDMEPGETVTVKGPLGHFTLPEDVHTPLVFLTAGVGITPIRSMLRDLIYRQEDRYVIHCDSNRLVESAPCLKEMQDITLPHYTYHGVITDDPEGWEGYAGYINAALLEECIDCFSDALFYVVGTKGFIDGMKDTLKELDIPDGRVIVDNFG